MDSCLFIQATHLFTFIIWYYIYHLININHSVHKTVMPTTHLAIFTHAIHPHYCFQQETTAHHTKHTACQYSVIPLTSSRHYHQSLQSPHKCYPPHHSRPALWTFTNTSLLSNPFRKFSKTLRQCLSMAYHNMTLNTNQGIISQFLRWKISMYLSKRFIRSLLC